MEVITSKKCTACLEVLPMRDYRFITTRMIYSSRCWGCEQDYDLVRTRKKAAARRARETPWADDETEVILSRYERGGTKACLPLLPGRTKSQVQNKARGMGIRYTGKPVSGSPPKERAWALPAHDYCEADMAFRQWGVPGMGRAVPELGMPVGVLSPSLGLRMAA